MADFLEPEVSRPLCLVERVGDELWLSGEIDISNAEDLSLLIAEEARAGVRRLNLTRVRFFSAAGIRMMIAVGTATALPDGGIPVVCSAAVTRALRLCRLTHVDGLRLITAPESRDGTHGAPAMRDSHRTTIDGW